MSNLELRKSPKMSNLYNQKHTGFTIKNKEKMRNFIHYLTPSIVSKTLSSCLILLMLAPIDISAQTREKGPWWPHPQWGAKDQAGASNWITETKVLRAVKLVTTGKVYELGHVYTPDMPLWGQRTFSLVTPNPYKQLTKKNTPVWNVDYFSGEFGQIGTQFDALGHTGMTMKMADGSEKDVFYNGFTRDEVNAGAYGLQALGVEKVPPIITRGILIDIAAYKGIPILDNEYEVTMADVLGALELQGMNEETIESGDAILFNYGWANNWKNRAIYNDTSSPGIGVEVGLWIAERKACLAGADSPALEVLPMSDSSLGFPVHQELLIKNGIFILENMDLRGLATDRIYEFMFIFTPIPFKGASGSPGSPVAIH